MKCRNISQFHKKIYQKNRLLDAQLELTYRCNLKCCHCYCSGLKNNNKELPFSAVKKILDELASNNCLWLVLTGGEPLLRQDFSEIYSYARQKGFLITIYTNGLLLNRKILNLFRGMPPHSIEVTLNAATEKTYRKITGVKGCFKLALDNIKLMAENNLPVVVKMNLMTLNCSEFSDIKKWVFSNLPKKKGTYSFKYDYLLFPRLNGDCAPLKYRLSPKELERALSSDKDAWLEHQKDLSCSFPKQVFSRDKLYHCNEWQEQAYINPYGEFKFCPLIDKYSADLRKTGLAQAFSNAASFVENEKFKTNSKCRSCKLRVVCLWCPARAFLETGSEEKPIEYYCRMAQVYEDKKAGNIRGIGAVDDMTEAKYFKAFDKAYRAKLSRGIKIAGVSVDRYKGFRKIFEELLNKKNKNFVIVETGCTRGDGWSDGNSTFLFYEFLSFFGGKLIAIDKSRENLDVCGKILQKIPKTGKAEFISVCKDSVKALKTIKDRVDLLYLDSFDLDLDNPEPSMMHHLKEFQAASGIIRRSNDMLIAVDDNFFEYGFGKGKYVLEWAKKNKKEILHEGYQAIFKV